MSDFHPSEAWVAQSACAGLPTEWFFTDSLPMVQQAKKVCAGCPVRTPCKAYGGLDEGVWGGETLAERRGAMPEVTDLDVERHRRKRSQELEDLVRTI